MPPFPLSFRQQCALILLGKYADKLFDEKFKQEAQDAGLDPERLLSVYIEPMVDEMCRTYA